ncbi:hypothetical protein KBD81_00495 [Candidatus Woesebacteria bacterium]|nr:hypothetical protein [Candidatus Woesebacteria bacterium]
MKVTLYTINDCKFSEAERAYLKQNNIEFEEKNLETNRDFLTEMLAISNNFAGTPVTEIVKETGEKIVLKGFTPEEFDKVLGITSAVVPMQTVATVSSAPDQVVQQPVDTMPAPAASADLVQEVPQAVEPVATVEPPMPVGTAMPTAPQSEPTPIAVESLSQDSADVVPSPSESLMPPMPAAAIPQPMPAQTTEENIGPISLDVTPAQPVTEVTQVSPEPLQPIPMSPVTAPFAPVEPQAPQASAPNPLDSVLQNLQNQVGPAEQKKDDSAPTM